MKDRKNIIIVILLITFIVLNIVIYLFNYKKSIIYIGDTTKVEVKNI